MPFPLMDNLIEMPTETRGAGGTVLAAKPRPLTCVVGPKSGIALCLPRPGVGVVPEPVED